MTQKTLSERATIALKHELSREETEELLRHMCRVLRANVNYHFNYEGNIFHEASGMPTDDSCGFEANAVIRRLDDMSVYGAFETKCSITNYQKAAAIQFKLLNGENEKEYKPETFKLWDDVRKAVDSYFQQKLNDGDCSA